MQDQDPGADSLEDSLEDVDISQSTVSMRSTNARANREASARPATDREASARPATDREASARPATELARTRRSSVVSDRKSVRMDISPPPPRRKQLQQQPSQVGSV